MANPRIPTGAERLRMAATSPLGQSAMRGAALWLWDRLADWHASWRERQALEALDDRLLRDLGLTHEDVGRETVKPFWRP